jgi:hypothetical protein
MSLSEFPVELLDLCLENVRTRDLFALRATSRRLRDVVAWSGRVRVVMTRTADSTDVQVGDVYRRVIEEDLITNHTQRGLDFILENVRELWLEMLPAGPFKYHYRDAHILLDSILQVFENGLGCSRLEHVHIWRIVALDVDSAGRLMERINVSSLDFVVPDIRFHKMYNVENEHDVSLGDKFLNVGLELSSNKASLFPHVNLNLATRLTHLDIIGKTTQLYDQSNWTLEGLSGLWKQCQVLTSVQFSGEKSEVHFQIPYRYIRPETLPRSLKTLILAMCSISFEDDSKVVFADNVSLVSIVCDSSMFLKPIIGSMGNLTLKTKRYEALDIMFTCAFTQSPLRRLSLHVNTLSNVHLSQLSNLSCLEDLQISMNEKPTRNLRNSFRRFLAENPNLNVMLSIHRFGRITSWNMRSYLQV